MAEMEAVVPVESEVKMVAEVEAGSWKWTAEDCLVGCGDLGKVSGLAGRAPGRPDLAPAHLFLSAALHGQTERKEAEGQSWKYPGNFVLEFAQLPSLLMESDPELAAILAEPDHEVENAPGTLSEAEQLEAILQEDTPSVRLKGENIEELVKSVMTESGDNADDWKSRAEATITPMNSNNQSYLEMLK